METHQGLPGRPPSGGANVFNDATVIRLDRIDTAHVQEKDSCHGYPECDARLILGRRPP